MTRNSSNPWNTLIQGTIQDLEKNFLKNFKRKENTHQSDNPRNVGLEGPENHNFITLKYQNNMQECKIKITVLPH